MAKVALRDQWTIIAPVEHVELFPAVNEEFRICDVTLITTKALTRRRRRFGLPHRIAKLRTSKSGWIATGIIDESSVVAVMRLSGSSDECEPKAVTAIRDELALLSASQLFFTKRQTVAAPSIKGERSTATTAQLWLGSSGSLMRPMKVVGPAVPLQMEGDWLHFQKQGFFSGLLRILRGEVHVAKSWRDELRRAAILVGLSQSATCLADAFLWNMIALELLLTRQGDRVGDTLPSRAEAFLGWSIDWRTEGIEQKIRAAYERRCRMVHQGFRDGLTGRDLYFTDDLIFNLLVNLVARPEVFSSKDQVVEFARRVEAQRLLGLQPDLKGMSITRRRYSARDYEIY